MDWGHMRKNLLFYIAVLSVFGIGIYLILQLGSHLHPGNVVPGNGVESAVSAPAAAPPQKPDASPSGVRGILLENLRHPLSILLLQVIGIVVAARVLGDLFAKIGQPAVIGEVVAGILLGPSLLGMLSHGAEAYLFPASSLNTLSLLSQVGVILFMFAVGIELDLQHLREKAQAAILVSHASIIVPFFLGTAFSLLIYPTLAPPHIAFSAFALFIGVAMSITAFPVLARIVTERGLFKTHLGNTVIACAAVDDVTAWCILAVIVAIVKAGGMGGSVLTVTLVLLFIGVMLFLLRPQVERLIGEWILNDTRSRMLVAGVLAFTFASALYTEAIGIHALFGAFLAGVVMPSDARLRAFLRERLETFSSVFLLPLYFAFTGLRTQVGLLSDWRSWVMCLGIVAVAIAGKLGGSTLAARWTGMDWSDSLSIGALMNTRGLVELIVLNIGYDLGILPPRIFTMLVLMALATTFMTGPLLAFFGFARRRQSGLAMEHA